MKLEVNLRLETVQYNHARSDILDSNAIFTNQETKLDV